MSSRATGPFHLVLSPDTSDNEDEGDVREGPAGARVSSRLHAPSSASATTDHVVLEVCVVALVAT